MARCVTIPAELGSAAADFEIDSTSGSTITVDTAIKHSGAASWKFVCAAGGPFLTRQFTPTANVNDCFFRAYIDITSITTASSVSIMTGRSAASGNVINIRLTRVSASTYTLALWDEQTSTQIGSASPVLNTSQQYRLEFSYLRTAGTFSAYIDGVVFATGTGSTLKDVNTLRFGSIDSSTMTIYFDDVAVNDNLSTADGSNQTLPGPGNVIVMLADSAGDVNTFATQTGGTAGAGNNFTRINEKPADDATTFNGSSTLNQEDMFNFAASGLGSTDFIRLVEVWGRYRNSTADPTAAIRFQIMKTTGGTKAQSAAIVPNSTTFRQNANAVPKVPPIVAYQDPDGARWTSTTLGTVQAGYKLTVAPGTAGRRIDVTQVALIVEYIPVATVGQTVTGKASILNSVPRTVTGKSRIQVTSVQTVPGKGRIQKTVAQTVAGVANILATVLRTVTGKGAILRTTLQTIPGLARIQKTVSQTVTGVARFTATTARTIPGVARFTASASRTITGLARITRTTAQTIPGVARITAATARTITGLGRITKSVAQTINGKARIQKAVNQTITGLGRITATTARTISGLADILKTTSQTITGKARIMRITAQTIPGVARLTATTQQVITGVAAITSPFVSTTKTITGLARITAQTIHDIPGVARITAQAQQTINGLGRITKSTAQTIAGKARITASTTRDILGRGRIEKAASHDITGQSRISIIALRTVAGRARIDAIAQAIIAGRASLRNTVAQDIQGVARIVGLVPGNTIPLQDDEHSLYFDGNGQQVALTSWLQAPPLYEDSTAVAMSGQSESIILS